MNPFESLYIEFDGVPLISRSALKLCSIDALTGFCMCKEEEVFVDLCGAPGGFSQYLLFRDMKGYGMSLTGKSDDSVGVEWDVDNLDPNKFHVHGGLDETGNIHAWDNVTSLQQQIVSDTGGKKVTLVVADGGIDAQRNNMDQEMIAHELVTCQVAAALLLLDIEGTFVIKMFGFHTQKTRQLISFLADVFDQVQVLKPITSRPASSERYVMFRGFKGLSEGFDVLEWRETAISGLVLCKNDDDDYRLHRFLDEVDHDMVSLNIRACSNIIECLRSEEEKCLGRKRRAGAPHNGFSEKVNVEYIKKEWRILGHEDEI